MLSRVNLVAILLTLNCVSRAMEHSRPAQEERRGEEEEDGRNVASGKKILRYRGDALENPLSYAADNSRGVAEDSGTRRVARDEDGAHSGTEVEERDRPRNRKRRMDRTMLALLMAYKLKFMALIPTMLGGLILLKGTTLLAGFFFALFAAVLGLKIH